MAPASGFPDQIAESCAANRAVLLFDVTFVPAGLEKTLAILTAME